MSQVTAEQTQQQIGRLWFDLLAGPIVYSLHFLVVYLLVEVACKANLLYFTWLGLDGISLWVLALTAIACLVTGYSTANAIRTWRRGRHQRNPLSSDNTSLMGLTGAWLSGFFTILIFLTGLPAAFLTVCSWI